MVVLASLLIPGALRAQGPASAAPPRDDMQQAARTRRQQAGNVWIPPRAAVMRDGSHWIGPAYSDRDLNLDRPWRDGRFRRGIGPDYVWRLDGGTCSRFSFGGARFAVAPADCDRAADWRWTGDDLVLYPDPAHDGWYRAYNTRLESYVHIRYLGDGRPIAGSPTPAAQQ